MCEAVAAEALMAGSINLMLEPKFCRWLPIFQKSKFSKNRNFQKIEIFKKNWCWNRNFVAGYQFFKKSKFSKNRNFQKIEIFKKKLMLEPNFCRWLPIFQKSKFSICRLFLLLRLRRGGVYIFDAAPLIFPLTNSP